MWRVYKYNIWDTKNGIELIERVNWDRRDLFKCHCWKAFMCRVENIFTWHSKSCWCWIHYNRKEPWMSNFRASATKIMAHIKRRWIELRLSVDDIINIMKQPCKYCWDKWWNTSNCKSCLIKTIRFNWLDRVDSSKWYVKLNVVPCCKRCNWAKNEMNLEDFLSHNERIYNFNRN